MSPAPVCFVWVSEKSKGKSSFVQPVKDTSDTDKDYLGGGGGGGCGKNRKDETRRPTGSSILHVRVPTCT